MWCGGNTGKWGHVREEEGAQKNKDMTEEI